MSNVNSFFEALENEKKKKKQEDVNTFFEALNTTKTSSTVKTEEDEGWFKSLVKDIELVKAPEIWKDTDSVGEGIVDTVATMAGSAADLGIAPITGAASLIEGVADLLLYGTGHVIKGAAKLIGADEEAQEKASKWAFDAGKIDAVNSIANESAVGKWIEDRSIWGRTTDAIVEGVGQVALTMPLSGISALGKAAQYVPLAVNALSSVGSGMSEAYTNEATDSEAALYGLISGATSAISESIFGGLGKGVNALGYSKGLTSIDDMLAKKLTSKINNVVAKNVIQWGIKSTAEGLEGIIDSVGQTAGKKLTYMSEKEWSELFADENFLESFVTEAMASALMQAPSAVQATQAGQDFVTEEVPSAKSSATSVSDLTADERTVFDKEVEKRVAEKEESGKTVTAKEKKAIEDAVVRDIEKGYITTDVIEEALGGEDYKAYKDAVESEDAMRAEFEELGKLERPTLAQQTRYQELYSKKDSFTSDDKRNELKTSLGEKVRELTNGSRLSESYAERARRSQAFTADVTKYSEKQREVVQKAIDSGVLNNTNRSHEFVDIIAKVYEDKGVSFDFTNNARLRESGFALDGVTVNGYVTKDGITINMDSPKAWQSTVGHEITHVLEGTELYTTLQEAIFKYANRAGTFDAMRKKITDTYKNIEGADISKELTAELVGEYLFTDEAFVKHLSVEHRNVFQKIYDEIKYLMKVVTAGSKEARQLEAVKHTFEKIYREGTAQKNTVGDGEVRYSLSDDDIQMGEQVADFFESVLRMVDTSKRSKRRSKVGEISQEHARVVETLMKTIYPDFSLDGYELWIDGTAVDHIETRHGVNGEHDHSMSLREDRIMIPHITNSPDSGEFIRNSDGSLELSDRFRNYDNSPSPQIRLVKTIPGYMMYVSECVPDSSSKRIYITSAYKTKIKGNTNQVLSIDPNRPPQPTPEAIHDGSVTSNSIISQPDPNVNTQNSLSLTDEDLAPVGDFATPANELRYEGDVSDDLAPVREDLEQDDGASRVPPPTTESRDVSNDIAPIGDDVVIKTTAEKLTEKRNHSESERESLTAFREANAAKYDKLIADKQAEYDALKNKDSKKANSILQSIERLKRLKADIDADYAKRIGNSEARTSRLDAELSKDHTKKDKLARAYARIDKHLEADKTALKEEFDKRAHELEAQVEDKDGFISARAKELYNELRDLKKGVRASGELGYLLDTLGGKDWSSLKTALVNVMNSPSATINQGSAIESTVRKMLAEEYAEVERSLENIEVDYESELAELEKGAERAREDARREATRSGRAQRHEQIINDIKARFSEHGYELDQVLKGAKDLSTFATADNTPQRVMEKALGYKEGGILADMTVNKVAQNESEGIRWLNQYTDRKRGILKQLSDKYHIKPGSKESAAAQMYAEGFYVDAANDIVKYGDAELAADFPSDTVRQNIKLLARDPLIRRIYDDTLEAINASRVRNAYPEIQRLDNYFLHFRAMADTFSRLGLPFNPNDIRANDLPTDLNGVTADLKPGQPYFASAKHREGIRTSFDLLGGLESYLTSAKNQIYHIDDIQTLRALRNYIADGYGQARGLESLDSLTEEEAQAKIKEVFSGHLSTFAKFLNEEANVIAGKTALIDRGLEGIIGRRGMTFMNDVNKQVGANQVGYNVSSAMTNLLASVQAFARTNKFDFIKGFTQTVYNRLGSIVGKGDGFRDKSSVMIRREGADRFYRKPWQKASDAGYALAGAVDSFSTEIIARAKVNEYMRKGMSEEQAHYEADKWTSRLMGDRSLGQQPQLFNSKMLGLVTKYQLEVRNQLDAMFYDTIKEAQVSSEHIDSALARNAATAAKVTAAMFELAVGQHIFGKVFESIAGYNPAFDIIDVLIKALGLDDDEDETDTVLDNIEEGFQALLDDLPYTSVLTGGRIPMSSALPITQFLTGKDEYGNEKSRVETLLEAAPYYLMPGGYGQIKKTAKGLRMFATDERIDDISSFVPGAAGEALNEALTRLVGGEKPVSGSYTDSGKLRFSVDETPWSVAQAALFGEWASENAREYFDGERSALSEKQTEEYIESGMTMDEYWDYRDGLKGLSTLAEKADYIAGLELPVDKKNILINNIADRKEPIDMTDYDEYGDFEEFDWAMKNPEKYTVAKAVGGYDEYKEYSAAINAISADKDADGNSINGSKKKKVEDYINSLDIPYGQKIILLKSTYSSDDTYNADILEYLNEFEAMTYDEKKTLLEALGFTVEENGEVRW